MRRRLYFLSPDVDSARRIADDLLLARVEDRHMHVLAKRGTDLGELHEAGYSLKSDLVHAAGIGLGLGGLGGFIIGVLILLYPIEGTTPHPVTAFVSVALGGALGAWIASMVGASVPNSKLRQFQADIDAGKVLTMVDVRLKNVEGVRQIVLSRHPEARSAGVVRPYPVFP